MEQPARISLLQRREIEARVVGPLIQAVRAEIGDERALTLLREVIAGLAREAGAGLARELGEVTLSAFATSLDRWCEGGALEFDLLQRTPEHLDFNVTRCRYAEMYRALGMADLGASLSCCRDFALVEGFEPAIRLARTQTLMEGAPFCDFRFEAPPARADDPSSPQDAGAA